MILDLRMLERDSQGHAEQQRGMKDGSLPPPCQYHARINRHLPQVPHLRRGKAQFVVVSATCAEQLPIVICVVLLATAAACPPDGSFRALRHDAGPTVAEEAAEKGTEGHGK